MNPGGPRARTRGAAPALEAASGSFAQNLERRNSALFRARARPIGSGVSEAACKTLVKLPLCGKGMKWTRSGAQTGIPWRALLLSTSRWASLWTYFDKNGFHSHQPANIYIHWTPHPFLCVLKNWNNLYLSLSQSGTLKKFFQFVFSISALTA